MTALCPNCRQTLQFTEVQQKKILQALKKLPPGTPLTIKCPHCKEGVTLDGAAKPATSTTSAQPPVPPNLDWLQSGRFATEEKVEDVPMALVLYQDSPRRKVIVEALETVGYQVVPADTTAEALEKMQFGKFSCVALQSELEGELDNSAFHSFMRAMPMERRRYIFYILFGPQMHSLYDLEALAHSANLVVGEKDLKHLNLILRKSIPAYEELFGPILEELAAFGKR